MECIFGSFWLAILQILPQDLATHTNIWENGSVLVTQAENSWFELVLDLEKNIFSFWLPHSWIRMRALNRIYTNQMLAYPPAGLLLGTAGVEGGGMGFDSLIWLELSQR